MSGTHTFEAGRICVGFKIACMIGIPFQIDSLFLANTAVGDTKPISQPGKNKLFTWIIQSQQSEEV